MKLLFFLFLNLIYQITFSQFAFEKDWFTSEDFFVKNDIQAKHIKSIKILQSDKRDDEPFTEEEIIAKYYFRENGTLIESHQYIRMKNRLDTSIFTFNYLESGELESRIEIQGPFSFTYKFKQIEDSILFETKIDNHTNDTNYTHHSVTSKPTETVELITIYNSIQRPMKKIRVEKDIFGQVVLRRKNYARSLSFVEKTFEYNATQLIYKSKWNTIGKQSKTDWAYAYINGFVDEITIMKNEKMTQKSGLLYNNKGLIKAVVSRDIENKSIRIYKIVYEYFY